MNEFCKYFCIENESIIETSTKFCSIIRFTELTQEKINDLKKIVFDTVSHRDKGCLYAYQEDDQIDLNYDLSEFELENLEFVPNAPIFIELNISKNIKNGKLSVYNFEAFSTYFSKLNFLEVLANLEDLIFNKKVALMELQNEKTTYFSSVSFSISNSDKEVKSTIDRQEVLNLFYENVKIIGFNNSKFIPEDFNNVHSGYVGENHYLIKFLERARYFYSICFIVNKIIYVDATSFKVEVISEKRMVDQIQFANVISEKFDSAFSVYRWIYSTNTHEKLNIVRYFIFQEHKDEVFLNGSIYESAKFSYKQFMNKKIYEFIDVQKKALIAIEDYQSKYRDLRKNVVSIFKANSFTILGFFISTFITRQISVNPIDLDKIINVGYFIMLVFFIYLLLTSIQIFFEAMRFKNDFNYLKENLKKHFVKKAVDDHLPTSFICDEIKYLIKYSSIVLFFWILELVAMFFYLKSLN